MKIWAMDDAHTWGVSLLEVAQERGHNVTLFDTVKEVKGGGVLFYHMHAHPAVREHHKRAMAQFATRPELQLIPSYQTSKLYDDRLEQLRAFGKHMPATTVFKSPAMAKEFLATSPDLPLISKCQMGPGTRALNTLDEAQREVKLAFSDFGIENRYKVATHGAVYWQEFVPHDVGYRVIVVGSQSLLRARVGKELIPVDKLTEESEAALSHARSIADEYGIKFGGIDLIKRRDGKWFLMKIVAGWSLSRFLACRFTPDGRTANEFWHVMCDELEKGNLC